MSWHLVFLTNPPFDSSKILVDLHRKKGVTVEDDSPVAKITTITSMLNALASKNLHL